jgi:hypothetical protein
VAEQQKEQNPVAERLMAVVEEEFGDRLDEDGRTRIRAGLTSSLANAAAMLMYPIKNGDEPGTVFHATKG